MGDLPLDNWIRLTFQSAIDLKGAASNSVLTTSIKYKRRNSTFYLFVE